jgi:hypothetical protein
MTRRPRIAAEMQRLASDRIATYMTDPVHPLPQYKHKKIQASMAGHIEDMLPHLKALSIKINEDNNA